MLRSVDTIFIDLYDLLVYFFIDLLTCSCLHAIQGIVIYMGGQEIDGCINMTVARTCNVNCIVTILLVYRFTSR